MNKRILWMVVSGLMVLSLVMAACGPTPTPTAPTTPAAPPTPATPPTPPTPPTAVEKEAVKPSQEVPKYGGTFTLRGTTDQTVWDPYSGSLVGAYLIYETLAMGGWMEVPPETWDFATRFVPLQHYRGLLAESWELGDYQTITFRLRKGAHFQNIPPVNGREITASDIVYSYNRVLGLGDGYTKPSPYVSVVNLSRLASVSAPNKQTVVFKMSEPTMEGARELLDDSGWKAIVPREGIEKWGDLNDWRRAIGSGPYIIKDYVAGSSVQLVRNPNYYLRDEQYPQDQLPYIDRVVYLIIPDNSTADAALRTGKLDMQSGVGWDATAYMKKTNPELLMSPTTGSGQTIFMLVDKPPFNDIRVRKALQMSIDLKTLAVTYFGGTVSEQPLGFIRYPGYRWEYADWPQEVKDGYAYNPDGAKKLLKEAGFPNGFKTTITTTSPNVDLLSIVKAYFSAIGVDMSIEVREPAAYTTYVRGGNAVMSLPNIGPGNQAYSPIPPLSNVSYRTKAHPAGYPQTHISDPTMEELYLKGAATVDEESLKKAIQEADKYIIQQQWTVNLLQTVSNTIYQPWVKKRYQGEWQSGPRAAHFISRLWIDQDLKKSMGH